MSPAPRPAGPSPARRAALGLVLNAVVLWNTRYIDATVARLRADGHPVRDEDVAGLSRWGTPTSTCSAAMPSARVPTGRYAHCVTRAPSTSSRRRPVATWTVAGQSALNAEGA